MAPVLYLIFWVLSQVTHSQSKQRTLVVNAALWLDTQSWPLVLQLQAYRPQLHITQTPVHYCIHTDLSHTSHRLLFITVHIYSAVQDNSFTLRLLLLTTTQPHTAVSDDSLTLCLLLLTTNVLYIHTPQYQTTVSHYTYYYSLIMYYTFTHCSIRRQSHITLTITHY